MNKNILALMPVFVFMIIMLIVSIYVRRASAKKASEGFVKDYFIGSRSLGGFVLAMTTVATYSSDNFLCRRTWGRHGALDSDGFICPLFR